MIESYGISHPGLERSNNQDRIVIDHSLQFFVVADGMGGHRHGEVAAELAIATMQYYLDSSRNVSDVSWPFGYTFDLSVHANRLLTSIRLANRQVWRKSEQAPECSGMGTTVASVILSEKRAIIGNVGDSRVYRYRASGLEQQSVDDTWIAKLTASGTMPPEQLLNHPMRNVLTQAAGSQEDVEVHLLETDLAQDDLFLISSDGLHGVVSDERLRSILEMPGLSLQQKADLMLEVALLAGGPDNVSVILLTYSD